MNLAQQLIKATSEEELSHILNEHNHRMNVLEARNERSKSEQLESFKSKLQARRNRRGNKTLLKVCLCHDYCYSITLNHAMYAGWTG